MVVTRAQKRRKMIDSDEEEPRPRRRKRGKGVFFNEVVKNFFSPFPVYCTEAFYSKFIFFSSTRKLSPGKPNAIRLSELPYTLT